MEKFWHNEKIRAALLYLAVTALFYAPVAFFGKTLLPPMYQPHGVTEGWAYGYEGRTPESTFNIDLATPAYFEAPVNRLTGELYKNGELPLWNPYQGAGAPLAAQYSTRVFFPYQALEDLSPVRLWDYFTLGRLFIAGFFTFLFLRSLGLGFAPSFSGGLFYMLSGPFTWFVNLEQFTNNAMMVPVHLYFLERLVQSGRVREMALCGVSFGLVLLAGQPEIALYALVLGVLYYLLRTFYIRKGRVMRLLSGYLTGVAIGFALAAPLLVPFVELATHSHNLHKPGGGISSRDSLNRAEAIGIFTPTVSEVPQMHRRATEGRTPDGEPFYFRIFPENGAWDRLGGYTGIIPVFLSILGLYLSFSERHRRWRPYSVFFISSALFIIFKNMGFRPFIWIGSVPLFDLVWTQRWAGPVWVFSLAASGAIGLQILSEAATSGVRAKNILAVSCALVTVLSLFLYLDYFNYLLLKKVWAPGAGTFTETISTLFSKEFIGTSFVLGSSVTVLSLLSGGAAAVYYLRSKKGAYAIAAIAFMELWWAAPRGYGNGWLFLKLAPLSIGVLAVLALSLDRFRIAVSAMLAFFVSFSALDYMAPRGFPEKYDPFKPAPYVDYLKGIGGHDRVIAGEGMLFPNFASALKIQDIRFINSLSIEWFQGYKDAYLQNEENHFYSLWFTGRMTRSIRGKGVLDEKVGESVSKNLPRYSFLGVRYIILPQGSYLDLPVAYSGDDAVIYENTQALPRAYLAHRTELAPSFKEAQAASARDGFDLRDAAAVEEAPPAWYSPPQGPPGNDGVKITGYKANTVGIMINTDKDALLVLTDIYYPGWKAYVDGTEGKIYRVNGLVRGVFVKAGSHTVEFRYMPPGFIAGAAFFFAGLFAVCVMLLYGRRARKKA